MNNSPEGDSWPLVSQYWVPQNINQRPFFGRRGGGHTNKFSLGSASGPGRLVGACILNYKSEFHFIGYNSVLLIPTFILSHRYSIL